MSDPRWAPDGSAPAVAAHLADAIRQGARALAFPGGSTPGSILPLLAGLDLPWADIVVRPSDERIVPPGHPASNHAGLAAALSGTGARVAPLEEGAAPGRFGLVWIGMGEDGHIASIFPNMAIAPDDPPAVVRAMPDPLPPEAPHERLTLNYRALADADQIILVARGAAKKRLLDQAAAGSTTLPVGRFIAACAAPITLFWSA